MGVGGLREGLPHFPEAQVAPTGTDLCPTPHLSLPRGSVAVSFVRCIRVLQLDVAEGGLKPSVEVSRQPLTDAPAPLTSGQELRM